MFYISYSREECDIISANNFEILFEDFDHQMNCRKNKKNTKNNVLIKKRKHKSNLKS